MLFDKSCLLGFAVGFNLSVQFEIRLNMEERILLEELRCGFVFEGGFESRAFACG